MVRLRQILDQARHRLIYLPLASVFVAIVLSQATLAIDGRLDGDQLPDIVTTTVDSGRSILSALAGGLISSVTLLLSMTLVAVQLASSQFSPRTLRNWIGDRTMQRAIGLVLGTVVYCLLVLRQTRTLAEGASLAPHVSVIVAVLLSLACLIAVVASVDHLTDRLRVGAVATGIMDDTLAIIERSDRLAVAEGDAMPVQPPRRTDERSVVPEGALAVTAARQGWVQQVDSDAIAAASPKGSTVQVAVPVGTFAFPQAPLAWVWPTPDDAEPCAAGIRAAIALGDTRTMQQDIGFGVLQMVDIALRALSPGVNDPNTANDLVVHLGVVLLAIWERDIAAATQQHDGRTVIHSHLDHGDYLHAAFDPLRIHGTADPAVAATMTATLATLRREVVRRALPGPLAPIDEVIEQIVDAVERGDLSEYDKRLVASAAGR